MQNVYGPLLDKTFETVISNFILTEFPRLGGPKVIELFVKELKTIIEQYYPPITNLKMGQMLWFAVAKDEKKWVWQKYEESTIASCGSVSSHL
jgi:hypothetical protein